MSQNPISQSDRLPPSPQPRVVILERKSHSGMLQSGGGVSGVLETEWTETYGEAKSCTSENDGNFPNMRDTMDDLLEMVAEIQQEEREKHSDSAMFEQSGTSYHQTYAALRAPDPSSLLSTSSGGEAICAAVSRTSIDQNVEFKVSPSGSVCDPIVMSPFTAASSNSPSFTVVAADELVPVQANSVVSIEAPNSIASPVIPSSAPSTAVHPVTASSISSNSPTFEDLSPTLSNTVQSTRQRRVLQSSIFDVASSSIEDSDASVEKLECQVCGDVAINHVHYGGTCCFSCKAFFRRVVSMTLLKSNGGNVYECKRGEGRCEISVRTRKSCQHCRFQKCLSSGLVASMVLSEDEKRQRFRKSLKTKTKIGGASQRRRRQHRRRSREERGEDAEINSSESKGVVIGIRTEPVGTPQPNSDGDGDATEALLLRELLGGESAS